MRDGTFTEELLPLRSAMAEDRQALTRIPEDGWNLPGTTAYLQRRLEETGLEWELFQSKVLTAGIGRGPVVLLRAEMDALPVQEQGRGVRPVHYSGHDLNMAMLLAAARVLKNHEDTLPGRVLLAFHPAGEPGVGCKFMVERGFLECFQVSSAFGLHLDPLYPSGQISYNAGLTTACLDAFSILIQGRSGRGYSPYDAVSPLEIGAHIQLMLSGLLQRELPLPRQAVLSVGKAVGGTVPNQIPDKAVLEGTFRCLSEETRQYLRTRIGEICQGLASAYRGACSVEFSSTPAVFNDSALHSRIFPRLRDIFGAEAVTDAPVTAMGAEDFSYIAKYVPSAYFRLGSGQPAGHFDDALIERGAAVLLEALAAFWHLE